MSVEINTAFVQQYTQGITMLAQQKRSRLRDKVRLEPGINGKNAFFDQVGATAAIPRTTRHGDTPILNTPHRRRRVTLVDYEWGDMIDTEDQVRVLNDPTNTYSMSAASAMGRAIDDVIVAAAFAAADTGETGSTSTVFDTAYSIAAGGTGLTVAKLITARELLDAAENPDEPRYIAVSAAEISDLLNTTQVTSSDFNTVKALVQGEVNTFMGFEFVRTQRLGLSGTDTPVIAWSRSSLLLGIGQDIVGEIAKDPSKGFNWRVYYKMTIGATRMDETGVVRILCA